MLTNEEMAIAIQAGNQELMEQLWRQCYGFIRKQAYRWNNAFEGRNGSTVDDLTQSGYFALCEACKAFQPERASFCTLLGMYLKTEFAKVVGCYTASQKYEPLTNSEYLEKPLFTTEDGDEITLNDCVADSFRHDIETDERIFRDQCAEILRCKVAQLQHNQRTAVEMKYWQNATDQEIANVLQCSRTYANTSLKNGIKSLRKNDTDHTLKNLFDDMYYCQRNLYAKTGLGFFKSSGLSSPEYEVIRKDEKEQQRRQQRKEKKEQERKREKDIELIIRYFDVDRETAEEYSKCMQ